MAAAASTPSISSRTVIDCRHCRCPLFFSVLDRLEGKEPPPPFATFIPPPTLPADLPLPPPENQKSLCHLPSPTCTTNRIFFASFQLQLQVPSPHIVDPAEKYISLIIPAYNEEHRLPGALDETLNYLEDRAAKDKSFSYEVIIVDDGSADGTKRVAFDFVKRYTVENVRVVLLGRNHGKGEAIRKGMLHSRGELLLMLDADGATKVSDLEKLENQIHAVAAKEQKYGDSTSSNATLRISDVPIAAFGSRAHLEEKALASRKWYRNFLMKGFHLVVLLAAGPGIRDTQCGFKMFTRAAARKLFTNIRLKRWCFDVELVYLCKVFRIPMIEISVSWCEIPGSKVNLFSIPNMLWELGLMSVGYRTGMWKIHS